MKKVILCLLLLIPILINAFRAAVLHRFSSSTHLYYWYTVSGLICALCILAACMKLFGTDAEKSSSSCRWISLLSSETFGIYLLHVVPIYILDRSNAFEWLRLRLSGSGLGTAAAAVAVLILSAFVFLCSFAGMKVFRCFCSAFKKNK